MQSVINTEAPTEPTQDQQELPEPPVSMPRLGSLAIEADVASHHYLQDITDSYNLSGDQAENAGKGIDAWHERQDQIQTVRDRVHGLEGYQAEELDTFLNNQNAPFLKTVKARYEQEGKELSWATWLGQETSDEQLLNFLQWHDAQIESQEQSEAFKTEVERERATYIANIQKGVDEGKLHPDAVTYAIPRAQQMEVVVGDAFDTIMRGRGGYHPRGSNRVVLAQGSDADPDSLVNNLQEHFGHEMNHAVLGTLGYRLWDEALTEFIDKASKTGNWGINQGQAVHVEEIALIRMIATWGKQSVPIELFTRAYSSNWKHNPQGRMEVNQALTDAIAAAWWPGAIDDILGMEADMLAGLEDKDYATARNAQLECIAAITAMLDDGLRARNQAAAAA